MKLIGLFVALWRLFLQLHFYGKISSDFMRTLLSIILLLFFAVSCKTERKKIIDRFPNGNTAIMIVYPDQSDTTSCSIFVYHDNGNVALKATIEKGKYVGQKITYYHSGQIKQIDSLSQPRDTTQDECDGSLIRYYENGRFLNVTLLEIIFLMVCLNNF